MSTAVIVSGVMRHMANATSSWLIDADYYLITDDKIYSPQSIDIASVTVLDSISEMVKNSSVIFSSVNILIDDKLKFSEPQLNIHPELAYHPTISMAFKWKYAYNILNSIQSTKQYNKILLWRPDIYIRYVKPLPKFNKQLPIPNHYHQLAPLNIQSDTNVAFVSDVCVMVDWEMFKTLAGFFDYYVHYYVNTVENLIDVHELLARYLIERGIIIDGLLGDYMDYAILRDTTTEMFTDGMIQPGFSFQDLKNKQLHWWEENITND